MMKKILSRTSKKETKGEKSFAQSFYRHLTVKNFMIKLDFDCFLTDEIIIIFR